MAIAYPSVAAEHYSIHKSCGRWPNIGRFWSNIGQISSSSFISLKAAMCSVSFVFDSCRHFECISYTLYPAFEFAVQYHNTSSFSGRANFRMKPSKNLRVTYTLCLNCFRDQPSWILIYGRKLPTPHLHCAHLGRFGRVDLEVSFRLIVLFSWRFCPWEPLNTH